MRPPVRDHVHGRLGLEFEELGDRRLKNIARPVEAFLVKERHHSSAEVEHITRDPPLPPDMPSIAVLPFTNFSSDPEQEYFADGMVEEIITALARIRWCCDRAHFHLHLQGSCSRSKAGRSANWAFDMFLKARCAKVVAAFASRRS